MRSFILLACLAAVAGCGDDGGIDGGADGGADAGNDAGGGDDAGNDAGVDAEGMDGGMAAILPRESRSTTIDVSPDDTLVAMVNPEDDSVSVFQTSDNSRISRTMT